MTPRGKNLLLCCQGRCSIAAGTGPLCLCYFPQKWVTTEAEGMLSSYCNSSELHCFSLPGTESNPALQVSHAPLDQQGRSWSRVIPFPTPVLKIQTLGISLKIKKGLMRKKNKEKNIHNIFAAYFALFSVCHALESRQNTHRIHCLSIKSWQPICVATSTERDLLSQKKIAQHLTAKSTSWLGTQMSQYSHQHTFSGLTPTAWISQLWNSAELWINWIKPAFPYAKSQIIQWP